MFRFIQFYSMIFLFFYISREKFEFWTGIRAPGLQISSPYKYKNIEYQIIIYFENIYSLLKSIWYTRGNVFASRPKVRGYKPGWGRWIFSGLQKSSAKVLRQVLQGMDSGSEDFQARQRTESLKKYRLWNCGNSTNNWIQNKFL